MKRIAINGLGRIGRNFLRAVLQDAAAQEKLEICAINIGPGHIERTAHLIKNDSVLGPYSGTVEVTNSAYVIDGKKIAVIATRDASRLPWNDHRIDWVVDASGCFTKREDAELHLRAGAQRVLITAPAKNEDVTIVPGVNDQLYNSQQHVIVSLGSCTTNAIAPVLQVMHKNFGIVNGCITSIHAYTNSQPLLDSDMSKDVRRARAAALNIIPTTTGAAELMGKVLPELQGCLQAISIRVPTAKVSLIDTVFQIAERITPDLVHEAFVAASQGTMQGIVNVSMEPLVSSDYAGNNHSVVIDGLLTRVCGNLVQLFGWYDNEWGYSVRLKDFLMRA